MEELDGVVKIDVVSKVLKIIVYAMVLFLIVIVSTNLSIKLDIKNYDKVYGEKVDNKYYYKKDKELIEIKRIKDFYNNKVDSKTIKNVPLLYCNKKECLYIDLGDRLEKNNMYPKFIILVVLLIIAILELILYMRKDRPNITKYKALYVIFIIITIWGLGVELYNISNYYLTVNKNKNIVVGEVLGKRNDGRYVIKYEVNNKLYYIDSNTKNNTIYYKKNDVSKAFNKMNPFSVNLLIIYLFNIAFIIMTQFLKNKKIAITEDDEVDR